ncbi:uncharacterized protein MYCFIDRAFT_206910 [Pseudocercospora fijiensis CIRAD86]|uniref:Uncharacterized protein n=1 Tax=Pseudocercospora fijiensis (strain CIRAD86) TaxID=383855 RepID=M3BBW7_PSEFD|nr:uncharacterized protein MYCFIDRAFT_206910 [Pseudocercospora fijiensis CIRAD86]EME86688.1 hypothetical protein MYCFIDRAFT_206910 [Pseudocercospora fijiensis CIRAD86]
MPSTRPIWIRSRSGRAKWDTILELLSRALQGRPQVLCNLSKLVKGVSTTCWGKAQRMTQHLRSFSLGVKVNYHTTSAFFHSDQAPKLQRTGAAMECTSGQPAPNHDCTLEHLDSKLPPASRHNALDAIEQSFPPSHGNAVNLKADVLQLAASIMNESSLFGISDDEQIPEQIASPCTSSGIPIPTSSTGLTTLAYERALRNRIPAAKLARRGVYDIEAYKPTFAHLRISSARYEPAAQFCIAHNANELLSQGSPEDIINRMTPAILPGVHSHIDSKTIIPQLIHSGRSTDHVQGMLIFGQGKDARNVVHQRYRRQHAKRKRVEVEIEVLVPGQDEPWRPERRTIIAHAWLFSRIRECSVSDGTEVAEKKCPSWYLEGYLAGQLEPHDRLRISADAKGDEDQDGYIGRDVKEYEIQSEQREVRIILQGGKNSPLKRESQIPISIISILMPIDSSTTYKTRIVNDSRASSYPCTAGFHFCSSSSPASLTFLPLGRFIIWLYGRKQISEQSNSQPRLHARR